MYTHFSKLTIIAYCDKNNDISAKIVTKKLKL